MLKHNPMARPTIADVLGHPWMRGEVPTKDEFNELFKTCMLPEEENQGYIAMGNNFRISKERKRHRDGEEIPNIFNYDYVTTRTTFRPLFEQSPMLMKTQF